MNHEQIYLINSELDLGNNLLRSNNINSINLI